MLILRRPGARLAVGAVAVCLFLLLGFSTEVLSYRYRLRVQSNELLTLLGLLTFSSAMALAVVAGLVRMLGPPPEKINTGTATDPATDPAELMTYGQALLRQQLDTAGVTAAMVPPRAIRAVVTNLVAAMAAQEQPSLFPQRELRAIIERAASHITYLLSGRAPQAFHDEVASLADLLRSQRVNIPPIVQH